MGVLKSVSMLDEHTVEIVFKDDMTFDLEGIKMSYAETKAFTGERKLKRLVISGKKTDIARGQAIWVARKRETERVCNR